MEEKPSALRALGVVPEEEFDSFEYGRPDLLFLEDDISPAGDLSPTGPDTIEGTRHADCFTVDPSLEAKPQVTAKPFQGRSGHSLKSVQKFNFNKREAAAKLRFYSHATMSRGSYRECLLFWGTVAMQQLLVRAHVRDGMHPLLNRWFRQCCLKETVHNNVDRFITWTGSYKVSRLSRLAFRNCLWALLTDRERRLFSERSCPAFFIRQARLGTKSCNQPIR